MGARYVPITTASKAPRPRIATEKVLSSDIDGGGDDAILVGGVEADAGGVVALINALCMLVQDAMFMQDATV